VKLKIKTTNTLNVIAHTEACTGEKQREHLSHIIAKEGGLNFFLEKEAILQIKLFRTLFDNDNDNQTTKH